MSGLGCSDFIGFRVLLLFEATVAAVHVIGQWVVGSACYWAVGRQEAVEQAGG